MAELKPFEVIMKIDFGANDGVTAVAHAEKVAELVRCRDCKHRFESMTIKAKDERKFQIGHYCKATGQIVNDDDFCAWAERITDNGRI